MNNVELMENELNVVKSILQKYPNAIVFGSRVKGCSRKFSDLDICIKNKIKDYEYELLKEAFENSDLPFNVDLIIYDEIDDSFKKIIDEQGIYLSDLKVS